MAWQNLVRALSVPYGEPGEGFWGPKTVTLNFCEEDYVITHYIAELCNTLTNFLFVVLGVRGLKMCLKYQHAPIFVVAFLGYMTVGIASTLFHASLKYWMQLADELSMIYTTFFMMYATYSYGRSPAFRVLLSIVLAAIAWYITARYYETKDPQFHQDAYAVLTATVVFSNMWIMEYRVRPRLEEREKLRPADTNIPPSNATMSDMWKMVATGLGTFLAAWAIWNLDNIYCSTITGWRRSMQLPWAIVLEGHAWWHLGTGIGAYYYIVWRMWIHRCLAGEEDRFQLVWPSVFSFPEIVSRSDAKHVAAKKGQ
ncbi:dihydroceramidase [Microdochium nivale]|nr:dihydroceramidase [Microdochium nivale]